MAEDRRLARLSRLERIREVERRRAAGQVADTGNAHDRLHALAERSRALFDSYGARDNLPDGAQLSAIFAFRRELDGLQQRTWNDAERARMRAEQARFALSTAQHRRDLVSQKLDSARRAAAGEQQASVEGGLARTLNRKEKTRSSFDGNEP